MTVEPLDHGGESPAVHDFIAVHRQHVVFVVSLGPVEQPDNHTMLA